MSFIDFVEYSTLWIYVYKLSPYAHRLDLIDLLDWIDLIEFDLFDLIDWFAMNNSMRGILSSKKIVDYIQLKDQLVNKIPL